MIKVTQKDIENMVCECVSKILNEDGAIENADMTAPEENSNDFEDCRLPNGKFCVDREGVKSDVARNYSYCYKRGEKFNRYVDAPDGFYLVVVSPGIVLKHTGKSWMATKWDSENAMFRVRKGDDGKTMFVSDSLVRIYASQGGLIKLELLTEKDIERKRAISGALGAVRDSFNPHNPNPLIKNGTETSFSFD